MSRRPWSPTAEQRETVKLLASIATSEAEIAMVVDCDPKTLRKHCREELDKSRPKMKAFALSQLYKNIKAGKEASIFFYLKTQCGFSERQVIENTGPNGGPQQHEHKITETHHIVTADVAAKAAQILAAAGGVEAGHDE